MKEVRSYVGDDKSRTGPTAEFWQVMCWGPSHTQQAAVLCYPRATLSWGQQWAFSSECGFHASPRPSEDAGSRCMGLAHTFRILLWISVCTLAQASLVVQTVENLPAMLETQARSLGREGRLEKGMATHSSIPAWKFPGMLRSTGSPRAACQWATNTFSAHWPSPLISSS